MTASSKSAGTAPEQHVCRRVIDELVGNNSYVSSALVSTLDGFEVAASLAKPTDARKLAAMSSSLLALAEAMCEESETAPCRDVVIDAQLGRILLMDVPASERKLLLCVVCDQAATLGGVLWSVRNARDSIGRELSTPRGNVTPD